LTLSLRLNQLDIAGFRNIERVELALAPRVNVIAGNNGQGKTSVLEALYFLATSRSFRTQQQRELCQEGAEFTRVSGVFEEGGLKRRQRAVIAQGRRSLFIDEKKPESLAAYALRTPVVVFSPVDLQLVAGAALTRRTLLDRVALFTHRESADARSRYAKALIERQALLEKKGASAPELDAFEELMASYGTQVEASRERAADDLSRALFPAFELMADKQLELRLKFLRGGTLDVGEFRSQLRARREQDRRRKAASFGPQKDDLDLTLNGRSARRHASQGQQRVLTLALKAAELACVRQASGAEPLLLLDDVSSELDPTRVGAVYDFIRNANSQVFVTTTRPELFETPGLSRADRRDILLHAGRLSEALLGRTAARSDSH
jgi:DNA replication and repair protein RecF